MAEITTLAAMKSFVLRRLGSPVIQVELSDDQLEQCIEDAVQYFQNHSTGEGNYRDYIGFTIQNGVSAYDMSDTQIDAVIDVALSFTTDGISTLFSHTHNLLWHDFVTLGGYPGGPGGGGNGAGMTLAGYEIATSYLDDVQDMFSRIYSAQYSSARKEMILTPTPDTTGIVLLEVFKKELAVNLYNNELVKRLAVAEANIQWGVNLRKYNMTLPGGGTMNWESIYQDGKDEKEKIEVRIVDEGEPPMPFIE